MTTISNYQPHPEAVAVTQSQHTETTVTTSKKRSASSHLQPSKELVAQPPNFQLNIQNFTIF